MQDIAFMVCNNFSLVVGNMSQSLAWWRECGDRIEVNLAIFNILCGCRSLPTRTVFSLCFLEVVCSCLVGCLELLGVAKVSRML